MHRSNCISFSVLSHCRHHSPHFFISVEVCMEFGQKFSKFHGTLVLPIAVGVHGSRADGRSRTWRKAGCETGLLVYQHSAGNLAITEECLFWTPWIARDIRSPFGDERAFNKLEFVQGGILKNPSELFIITIRVKHVVDLFEFGLPFVLGHLRTRQKGNRHLGFTNGGIRMRTNKGFRNRNSSWRLASNGYPRADGNGSCNSNNSSLII